MMNNSTLNGPFFSNLEKALILKTFLCKFERMNPMYTAKKITYNIPVELFTTALYTK